MSIPALRFKDKGTVFPKWEVVSLKEIAERVKRKNIENNKNVLTISAQQGLINQEEYFNKSVAAKDLTNYYLLHKGDFAYNKSYSNGYPMGAIKCLNRYEKGVVSTLYICFNLNEKCCNSFFEQYFETGLQNKEIEKVAQEGARNHGLLNIGLNDFFNISLNIPSIQEQTKIANFLTAVDEKITQLTQKHDLLTQYKKGVMQQIFSQELRFKDDNGGDFPEWEEMRLGSIFDERSERGFAEAELLSVTMNDGVKRRVDIDAKDNSSSDKGNYKRVLKNDIVYNSMRMWQGASGVSNFDGIVSPAYTVLKSNNNNNSIYFAYLFKTKKMIQMFQRCSQGLTSDTWNLKYPELSKITVSCPSKSEQAKIANFFTAIDDKITATHTQLQAVKQYKQGLLQQMFV